MMSKSYLLSFAKAKGNMAAVALAAILMAADATVASAQNKATENKEIEKTVIGGVDDLTGVDPSATHCTSNGTAETDGDKIVCLYNVGAKKFLGVGGEWGTHATLDVSPYSIYMKLKSDSEGTYHLESKLCGFTDFDEIYLVRFRIATCLFKSDNENKQIGRAHV